MEKEIMNYEEICRQLGYDPKVEFVEVNEDGTIGFTVGKPDEILKLAQRAEQAGYPLSDGFKKALARHWPNRWSSAKA